MRYLLPTVTAMIALAGCTDTSKLPPAPQFPAPMRASYTQPYDLQVGDVLSVRLMLNPEMNEDVVIRPDGHLSTTVVPDEVAGGRTVPELEQVLRHDYAKDMQNPRLTVEVKSFAATRVYVAGEVAAPGEFVASGGETLSLTQAIARAGGTKMSGDDESVFIIRRATPGTPPEFLSVRYRKVTHAVDPTADVTLAPNDVVYVPKTGIAEAYLYYNQYLQQFVNPSFGFNYLVNPTVGAANVITSGTGATAGGVVSTTH